MLFLKNDSMDGFSVMWAHEEAIKMFSIFERDIRFDSEYKKAKNVLKLEWRWTKEEAKGKFTMPQEKNEQAHAYTNLRFKMWKKLERKYILKKKKWSEENGKPKWW